MKNSVVDILERMSLETKDQNCDMKRYQEMFDMLDSLGFEKPTYTLPPTDTIGVRSNITCLQCVCEIC